MSCAHAQSLHILLRGYDMEDVKPVFNSSVVLRVGRSEHQSYEVQQV